MQDPLEATRKFVQLGFSVTRLCASFSACRIVYSWRIRSKNTRTVPILLALSDADVATIPPAILKALREQLLTDKDLQIFLEDWKKTNKIPLSPLQDPLKATRKSVQPTPQPHACAHLSLLAELHILGASSQRMCS